MHDPRFWITLACTSSRYWLILESVPCAKCHASLSNPILLQQASRQRVIKISAVELTAYEGAIILVTMRLALFDGLAATIINYTSAAIRGSGKTGSSVWHSTVSTCSLAMNEKLSDVDLGEHRQALGIARWNVLNGHVDAYRQVCQSHQAKHISIWGLGCRWETTTSSHATDLKTD